MRRIPYVIDNHTDKMADVLNQLLADHQGKCLDIASAYFNVRGFRLIQNGLENLGSFRLLIGDEPDKAESVGLEPSLNIKRGLWGDLQKPPFTEETLRTVEDLIVFLRCEDTKVKVFEKGFLHAKCYLFYGELPPRAGLLPAGGGNSRFSNFTGPGLTSNKELNLSHKAVLTDEEVHDDIGPTLFPELRYTDNQMADQDLERKRQLKSSVGARAIADLDEWFERQWNDSRDFKEELIELRTPPSSAIRSIRLIRFI